MTRLAISLLVVCLVAVAYADEYGYAKVVGGASGPGIVGDVYFWRRNQTHVAVFAHIAGVMNRTSEQHGMHVHTYGDVSDPTIVTVAGHFRGEGTGIHGCPPTLDRDYGDMGNWMVNASGEVEMVVDLNLAQLTGANSFIGRAVVFHLQTDNCSANGETSSTVRLARGVIGVGNPANFPSNIFVAANFTSNTANNDGTKTTTNTAVCYLVGTLTNPANGTVVFESNADASVKVTGEFMGITGNHGLHVHAYGDIFTNDGLSLGAHYNPNNYSHGLPPATNIHAGDLGSVCSYDSRGRAYYQYTTRQFTLAQIIGRGVALHATGDNGTEPSYGSRIAQCVIGIAAPTTLAPTVPIPVGFPNCTLTPTPPVTTTGNVTTTGATTGSRATTGSTTGSTTGGSRSTTTSPASQIFAGAFVFFFTLSLLLL